MRLLPAMDDNAKKAYANSLLYVAEVYFMLEDYPKAKSEIGEALKIDPNGQDACYSMGVYYYKCEMDKPEAYRYFKKVIDIDPSTSTAKNAKDAIDFIRNDFDSKVAPDFSFISQDQ
jgi:Tfp pilus assembly protein PilF